jgi:hypothetical protein
MSKHQCVLKYGWRSWLSLSTAVAQYQITLLFLSNTVLRPQTFTDTEAVCLPCLLFIQSQHMPENDKQIWTWSLLAFLKVYCRVTLVPSCSRTLVACWTTRCMKGFLSLNPLAFTHVPPDVRTSKLCEGLKFGNSVGHCVYKIYGLFWWGISYFRLCCGRPPPPRKFKLSLRIFELVSQQKWNIVFVRPVTIVKGVGGIALESEDRRAEWTTWERDCGI